MTQAPVFPGIGTNVTAGADSNAPVAWPSPRSMFVAAALTTSCLVYVSPTAAPAAFFERDATTDHSVGSYASFGARPRPNPLPTASLIRDLKVRSGLTWEQLASMFGVSRRAVHGWASGARLNAHHTETLTAMRTLLRKIEAKGDPAATRLALLDIASRTARSVQGDLNPLDRLSIRRTDERWEHRHGDVVQLVDAD